jgi:protein-tyrosine-phosphatase
MKVLFVCLHGAAKSVIAAEQFRQRAAAANLEVEVAAAGLEPDPEIPSNVVTGLAAEGLDVTGRLPRRLDDHDLHRADLVVSFGCAVEDRVPSGEVIQWDGVPLVSDGFEAARDVIAERVGELVAAIAKGRA